MLAGTRHESMEPAALTAAKQSSATGANEDGSAVCVHDSAALATIADELTRIADELHTLNRNLCVTRCDGMETIGLAQLLFWSHNDHRVCR